MKVPSQQNPPTSKIQVASNPTYIQKRQRGVFGSQLLDYLVHLLAWLSPGSPKIEQGHFVQIGTHDRREVLGRVDGDEVGWR